MLKIREMYKSPSSREHYLAYLFAGTCIAITCSVLLIAIGGSDFTLVAAPAIAGISLVCARQARKNGVRLKSRYAIACTAANLAVLVVFIILLR